MERVIMRKTAARTCECFCMYSKTQTPWMHFHEKQKHKNNYV